MRSEAEAQKDVYQYSYRMRDFVGHTVRSSDADRGFMLLENLTSAMLECAIHKLLRDQGFFELLCRAAGNQDDGK